MSIKDEIEQLEAAIASLEAQRATLGNSVVEISLLALREKLTALQMQQQSHTQQRKYVTILFADIYAFTTLSETLDAEDVNNLTNAIWQRLDRIILTYGGRVDKHMGDAVMAIWGMETAHEDDPEQAIRAALEMQAEMQADPVQTADGRALQLRIGVNSGHALLSSVGIAGEYTAVGDTVNTANRLQHAAPVGGVLISHAVFQHVRGIFDVQPQEPIQLRGKAEAVDTYVVLQAKQRAFRMKTRGVEEIETRMIGRDTEIKRLQNLLYQTFDHELRLVTVVGEGGIGKSRLLFEFENWLELQPERVRCFKGRASLEMRNQPYALLRVLFAFRFQIQESDPPNIVRSKLRDGVGEILGTDPRTGLQADYIGYLLGFDLGDSPHLKDVRNDAQQIRDRALVYLRTFFQVTSKRLPTAIFLEDIHWADQSTLETIQYLTRSLTAQRLLIVCVTRPPLFERFPDWGRDHTRLDLNPLTKAESRQLVLEILRKVEHIPEALRELVVSGAEGNPYYLEEIIKMLIDDGVIVKAADRWYVEPDRLTAVRVPPTLTGVIQARLDSLSPDERTVLQQASVIGRSFWGDALTYLRANGHSDDQVLTQTLDDILRALRQRELIFRQRVSLFTETEEYIFKHALLREVTYESVLKRDRREYHARIAEWLVGRSKGRSGEVVGLIADHLEAAGKPEQAVEYLYRAGERAARQFANAAAVDYFSRVLTLISERKHAERYKVLLARERILDLQGARESQAADLAALKELAEVLYDKKRQAEVALRWSNFAEVTGDYEAAIAAAQTAVELALATQDLFGEAAGYQLWGRALWRQGNYPDAQARLEKALQIAQQGGLQQIEANCLRNLGAIATHQSRFDQSRVYYQEALRLYRQIGDRRGEGSTLNNLGDTARPEGDYATAKDYYEQSMQISRELGERWSESVALVNLSLVAHSLGDDETAIQYGQQCLDLANEIDYRSIIGFALTALGHAEAGLGNLSGAVDLYQQAINLRRQLGEMHLVMESLAGLACTYLALDEIELALEIVGEIIAYLAGNSVDGTEEPFLIYWSCYLVLQAKQDPRTQQILQMAYNRLQSKAAEIGNSETRRLFLENVTVHREIVRTFEQTSAS